MSGDPVPAALPANNTGVTRFVAGNAYATIPITGLTFQNQAPWTIEAWFSLDALVDNMTIFGKTGEFTLGTAGSSLTAFVQGQFAPLVSDPLLVTGLPYYACVIYDGQTMSLFLNGALVAQSSVAANPAATSNPLALGSGNPPVLGNGFYGEIQGLRLWNAAMNPQIITNYQFSHFPASTTNLLTQLDFTTTPPTDSSGAGIVPVLGASAVYVPFVPAVTMAVNSFCDTYNDASVNPGGSATPFSVAAWICPSLANLSGPMFVFANGVQESNSGATLAVNASGRIEFQVGDSPILTSTAVLADGNWAYVAATWSGGNGALYINAIADNSATNMALAGTLAAGEPMIGAIASVGAKLPISSFQGQIQSVCVWSTALTPAQVHQYMTMSPQLDPNCVAFYDLSRPPVQNQITLNPVGLVSGAAVAPTGIQASAASVFSELRPHLTQALPPAPSAPIGSTEFFAEHESLFDTFMTGFDITEAQRSYFAGLFATRLREGHRDVLNGTHPALLNCRIESLSGGGSRLVHIAADGTEIELFRGDVDPCAMWFAQLVIAVVCALQAAYGLAVSAQTFFQQGAGAFLGTRVLPIMPRLAAIFQGGVTPQAIWAAILLLNKYQLLMPLLTLSYQTVLAALSWWTILSLGVRVLLVMSPSAPLEILWLVAQLAYSIVAVQTAYTTGRPDNCPPARAEPGSPTTA
ncbi:LamG domain-containing protein [Allosphingosinicella sp.]|uniref:LamG domain-containing protein n=1 Tax=Allosphingosinicella sp. TaxID=2823234 RepID=UPI002F0B5C37